MADVVIDTNVLLVAEGMHDDVSEECVLACVERLQKVMTGDTVILDDGYRLLGEYSATWARSRAGASARYS